MKARSSTRARRRARGRPSATRLAARKAEPRDLECSICLATFKDGDELRELPCKHIFHKRCIDDWLTREDAKTLETMTLTDWWQLPPLPAVHCASGSQ